MLRPPRPCVDNDDDVSSELLDFCFSFFSPRERVGVCFTGVGLCVCLSVCVSVCDHDNKKIVDVDGFVPNFMGMFLGGKVGPSLCFVKICRGMWK